MGVYVLPGHAAEIPRLDFQSAVLSPIESGMATVHLTRHLYSFFPLLEGRTLEVDARTVGEVVKALESLAPGIGFYICDELGRLRTHVNIFVANQMIRDRRGLSDEVGQNDQVHILQALSGG